MFEEILDERKIKFKYVQNGKYGPHFKFPWSDATIFITTAEKKIRGPNWGWSVINELTLIPLVRYKEVFSRVRVKKAKFPQIASVGTPEGWANDYYKFLIKNPPKNTKVIYGDSRDNLLNLQPEYIDDLVDTYDSIMQDAYVRGLWVNMVGNRFYYSYDPRVNDRINKVVKWGWFHIAMDFNVNPMATSIWQWDGKKLRGIDQIKLPNADTRAMGRAMKARGYTPDNSILYPDPSGNNRSTKGNPDIVILREEFGYTEIRVRKKAPGFRQRQLHVCNLLDKGIIEVNPETQPDVKTDFEGVEQDQVTYQKDKSNPELTHFSDGVDYMCDILIPFKKPEKKIFQGTRM